MIAVVMNTRNTGITNRIRKVSTTPIRKPVKSVNTVFSIWIAEVAVKEVIMKPAIRLIITNDMTTEISCDRLPFSWNIA